MKIYRIKAIDHYSDDEHILDIQYLLIYGSKVEENPFYFRITAFWIFITDTQGYWRFHPVSWKNPILNVLHSNIIQLGTLEI